MHTYARVHTVRIVYTFTKLPVNVRKYGGETKFSAKNEVKYNKMHTSLLRQSYAVCCIIQR